MIYDPNTAGWIGLYADQRFGVDNHPKVKLGFGFRQRRSGFYPFVFRRRCPKIKKSLGEDDKTLLLVFEKLSHSVTACFFFFPLHSAPG